MSEDFNKPKDGFRGSKPRFGDKPSFDRGAKPFSGERKPRTDGKPSFDRGAKSFGGGKPFNKGGKSKPFDAERKVYPFKSCIIRLENLSKAEISSLATEKTLQELMKHFRLAVFGHAAGSEISIILDLSKNEVYGNNVDKLITVAASVAGIAFTKVAGQDNYFSGILVQTFKDRVLEYFEERQAKNGVGIIACRNEEDLKIEEAKEFVQNKAYLLEKLKDVYEERKEMSGFDKPGQHSGNGKQGDITRTRSFKDIDTTKSQGYLERKAKREKKDS